MRSLLIMSPSADELSRLERLWTEKDDSLKVSVVDEERLAIKFDDGYVFVDYLADGRDLYEDSELPESVTDDYCFYNIIYSNKETAADFIFGSCFPKECLIDNDHGYIAALSKLTREMLLCVSE